MVAGNWTGFGFLDSQISWIPKFEKFPMRIQKCLEQERSRSLKMCLRPPLVHSARISSYPRKIYFESRIRQILPAWERR